MYYLPVAVGDIKRNNVAAIKQPMPTGSMIKDSPVSAADSEGEIRNRDGHPTDSDANGGTHKPAEGPNTLPKDVIFGLLSAHRRRRVLEYLAEYGDQTTLSDLADHIAALENDTEARLLSSQERKRVYVALYQCHLPKMDDADVIDFDQSRGTVERRPTANQLYFYLGLDPTATSGDDAPQSDREAGIRAKLRTVLS